MRAGRRVRDVDHMRQVNAQHLTVEKQERTAGDVLGSRQPLLVDRQVREVSADRGVTHGGRMPRVLGDDAARNMVEQGGFGPNTQVLAARDGAHLC